MLGHWTLRMLLEPSLRWVGNLPQQVATPVAYLSTHEREYPLNLY